MKRFCVIATAAVALVVSGCQDASTPTTSFDTGGSVAGQPSASAHSGSGARFEFEELVGVPRPFTGSANLIRGVSGGGLPWAIDKGEARLDDDGTLRVDVEGLVLDPNDEDVIDRGLAGVNPVGAFKAILSCLTVDGDGAAATVNVETATVPATTGLGGGDAKIEETLVGVPSPCIAPIVFVTSPGGSWFAASGF